MKTTRGFPDPTKPLLGRARSRIQASSAVSSPAITGGMKRTIPGAICVSSYAEPVQRVPHRTQIATTEVIGVYQQRVEIVQVAAHLEEAVAYRPDPLVTIEEGTAKRVEQGDERQLDLGVSVVDSGIQESGYAMSSCQHVGAPHVAMDEHRRVGFLDEIIELFRQPLHPKQVLRR